MIKEIQYAKKIIIGHSTKSVLSAGRRPERLEPVDSSADLPAEVQVETSKDGAVVYTAVDGRFPIGFKAMRLEYDREGNLLSPGGIRLGPSEQRPKVRADDDEWLNPDNDPKFHMEDLFTQEPGRPSEALQIDCADGD